MANVATEFLQTAKQYEKGLSETIQLWVSLRYNNSNDVKLLVSTFRDTINYIAWRLEERDIVKYVWKLNLTKNTDKETLLELAHILLERIKDLIETTLKTIYIESGGEMYLWTKRYRGYIYHLFLQHDDSYKGMLPGYEEYEFSQGSYEEVKAEIMEYINDIIRDDLMFTSPDSISEDTSLTNVWYGGNKIVIAELTGLASNKKFRGFIEGIENDIYYGETFDGLVELFKNKILQQAEATLEDEVESLNKSWSNPLGGRTFIHHRATAELARINQYQIIFNFVVSNKECQEEYNNVVIFPDFAGYEIYIDELQDMCNIENYRSNISDERCHMMPGLACKLPV